jgi:hypothetical protein
MLRHVALVRIAGVQAEGHTEYLPNIKTRLWSVIAKWISSAKERDIYLRDITTTNSVELSTSRKATSCAAIRYYQHFIGPEGSLPSLQEFSTFI